MEPGVLASFCIIATVILGLAGLIAWMILASRRADREGIAAAEARRRELDSTEYWDKKLITARLALSEAEQNLQRVARLEAPAPHPVGFPAAVGDGVR